MMFQLDLIVPFRYTLEGSKTKESGPKTLNFDLRWVIFDEF